MTSFILGEKYKTYKKITENVSLKEYLIRELGNYLVVLVFVSQFLQIFLERC